MITRQLVGFYTKLTLLHDLPICELDYMLPQERRKTTKKMTMVYWKEAAFLLLKERP